MPNHRDKNLAFDCGISIIHCGHQVHANFNSKYYFKSVTNYFTNKFYFLMLWGYIRRLHCGSVYSLATCVFPGDTHSPVLQHFFLKHSTTDAYGWPTTTPLSSRCSSQVSFLNQNASSLLCFWEEERLPPKAALLTLMETKIFARNFFPPGYENS